MQKICLLNDSFPPLIDGVANVVMNYADQLRKSEDFTPLVVTPECPGAEDQSLPYPVYRYPSIDLRKQIGYTAGVPFSPHVISDLSGQEIALLHSHCPMASNYLARTLRENLDVPLVLTYHTKYDIDIANAIRGRLLQEGAIHALVESVSAADELWVVSEGAGENIRSLGYAGEYIVMKNGVDVPRKRASQEEVRLAVKGYDLPEDVPVFLFVGRLMWYKGLRIILDAMKALQSQQVQFRMVFIGGGGDETEVKQYAETLGLGKCCFFTGAIQNRDVLAAWYTRADLFLFPSTFDTNGLVVREAAACSLGTVMVGGSCAAEGVTDGVNGLFIEESAASLAVCLMKIMGSREAMHRIGEQAAEDLYLSWQDAAAQAMDRYQVVLENYRRGKRAKRHTFTNEMITFAGNLAEVYERAERIRTFAQKKRQGKDF